MNTAGARDREQYRKVFDEFDHDHSGQLDVTEIQEAMHRLGRRPNEGETNFIFALLEVAGNEGLNFEEVGSRRCWHCKKNMISLETCPQHHRRHTCLSSIVWYFCVCGAGAVL